MTNAQQALAFTNGNDLELVINCYRSTFISTFEKYHKTMGLDLISYHRMHWDDEKGALLAESLIYVQKHCQLPSDSSGLEFLCTGNTLTDKGKALLEETSKYGQWNFSFTWE